MFDEQSNLDEILRMNMSYISLFLSSIVFCEAQQHLNNMCALSFTKR